MMALPALFSAKVMAAVAATMSAVGVISQSQNAKAEAKAQANAADQNARTARLQAGVREDLIRKQNRARLGEQRAAVAQSGFDPDTGSLLELQGDSAAAGEFDALTTRYEGALQALSFSTQADSLRRSGSSYARTGFLNAAGTLLSAAASSKYGGGGKLAPVETRIIPGG